MSKDAPQFAPNVPRGPLVAGGLALLTAFASSQTWARALFISIQGTDTDRGIVTLLASLGVAALCVWHAFFGLRARWYFALGIAFAALAITMPTWFLVDVLTTPKTSLFNSKVRVITASWALYLTVIASAFVGVSFIWQLLSVANRPNHDEPIPTRRYRRIDGE